MYSSLARTATAFSLLSLVTICSSQTYAQDENHDDVIEFTYRRAADLDTGRFNDIDLILTKPQPLVAVPSVYRNHLKLPAGQGVLVTHPQIFPGETVQAGDIILRLDDKPISSAAVLSQVAKKTKGKSATLRLLRKGAPADVVVNLEALNKKRETPFRLGVFVDAIDDTLRSQLGIAEEQGLVVTQLLDRMPSKEAGIQVHDILLIVGDAKMDSIDALNNVVRDSQGKPLAITLLRGGKQMVVSVTPKKNPHEASPSDLEVFYYPQDSNRYTSLVVPSSNHVIFSPTPEQSVEKDKLDTVIELLTELVEASRKDSSDQSDKDAAQPNLDND